MKNVPAPKAFEKANYSQMYYLKLSNTYTVVSNLFITF